MATKTTLCVLSILFCACWRWRRRRRLKHRRFLRTTTIWIESCTKGHSSRQLPCYLHHSRNVSFIFYMDFTLLRKYIYFFSSSSLALSPSSHPFVSLFRQFFFFLSYKHINIYVLHEYVFGSFVCCALLHTHTYAWTRYAFGKGHNRRVCVNVLQTYGVPERSYYYYYCYYYGVVHCTFHIMTYTSMLQRAGVVYGV